MCGRFTRTTPPEVYAKFFYLGTTLRLWPHHNVAPSQDILGTPTNLDSKYELALLHWGLTPSWAKEQKTGYSMINVRAERVATKPAFRHAFKRN